MKTLPFPLARLIRRGRWFIALACIAPAALSAATVEERLTALEQQLETVLRENAALRAELQSRATLAPAATPPATSTNAATATGNGSPKPATTAAGATAVLPNGKEAKLVLGGFVQINAESGGTPDARWAGATNRFFVRRARIAVTASFAENFTGRLEGAFGAEALAPRATNTVQAMDAYVQWSKQPELVVRAGQFKTPFGYEQLTSDLKGYVIERTLANDRLTVGRQIGVAASGEALSRRINYAAGVFNGTGTNTSVNDNDDFLSAARLGAIAVESPAVEGSPLMRWSVGSNAFTSKDTGAFTGRRTGYGLDTQLLVGAAEVWAEWLRQELHPVAGVNTASEGWSVLGAYAFNPHWQGAVRYETYDSNAALMNTTTRTWTFGVNYLLKGDDLKFSLNYVRGTQPAPLPAGGRWLGRMQVIF